MIKLHLSNNLTVTGCDNKTLVAAKKALTLTNPSYYRIARITGSNWAAARDFKFYKLSKTDPSAIQCPRGFYSRFRDYLDRQGIEYEVEVDFVKEKAGVACHEWPEVTLRDYQKPLLENMLKVTEGVVEASTGSGKTVICCALARALGEKMTILVPLTTIQNQFKDEFKKWFNYDVGIINGDTKEIKDITIAMWQSLSADKELAEKVASQTSVLVVDECDGVVSDERRKILEIFKPNRLYGLSGSARRSKDDGRTEAIFFYLGPTIAEYKATNIIPEVEVVRSYTEIPVDEYPIMEDEMVNNNSRNNLITGMAIGEAMSGHKVLVLCKRRDHCQKILDKLPKSDTIWYADSDDPERNEVLMKMRSGEKEFQILVGTFSLLGRGTDIPSLDVLIIAGSLKSDVLTEQGSGRVLRLFAGKEKSKIIDIYDNKNPIYSRQAWERFKFYRSKNWVVKGIDFKK